jgi:hypothetical protein
MSWREAIIGKKIILSDKDYEAFLDQLLLVRGRYPFYLYSYILMPNHFRLLLKVHESPKARISSNDGSRLLILNLFPNA